MIVPMTAATTAMLPAAIPPIAAPGRVFGSSTFCEEVDVGTAKSSTVIDGRGSYSILMSDSSLLEDEDLDDDEDLLLEVVVGSGKEKASVRSTDGTFQHAKAEADISVHVICPQYG